MTSPARGRELAACSSGWVALNFSISGCVQVHMLEDTHEILQELCGDEWSNTHVAYVSRTTHANWAKTCLQLLQVTPNVSMDQLGALQVLPASCVCSLFFFYIPGRSILV